jgi:hypothetical protein
MLMLRTAYSSKAHFVEHHSGLMSREMISFVEEYIRQHQEAKLVNEAARKQGTAAPSTASEMRISPLPLLPVSHQLPPSTSATTARSFWTSTSIGKCPRGDSGTGSEVDDWRQKVGARLAELRNILPSDLTRALEFDPENVIGDSVWWEVDADVPDLADDLRTAL